MLVSALENLDVELNEITDRIDTLAKNKKLKKNDSQNLIISSNYIGASIRVIRDVLEDIENDKKN